MSSRFLSICGLAIFVFTLGATRVEAQTVAVGPYYALPSWDQKFACTSATNCPRFIVLSNWNSEAVLDRETGIVWERSPNQFPFENPQSFSNAHFGCAQKNTGGRKGWRLATVEELQSLVDINAPTLALPPGHPFQNIQGGFSVYWSATRIPGAETFGYVIGFGPGGTFGTNSLGTANFYWCVRGPGGPTS